MSVRENWEMACPGCGSDENVVVAVVSRFDVTLCSDGTEGESGDNEWDGNSVCNCGECGWSGKVKHFEEAYQASRDAAVDAAGEDVSDNKINRLLEKFSDDLPILERLLGQREAALEAAAGQSEEDTMAAEVRNLRIVVAIKRTFIEEPGEDPPVFAASLVPDEVTSAR